MCSSAPDTSGINAAAKDNAALGKEALDWYKQAYNDQAPARAAAAAQAQKVSDAQLTAMGTQTRIANDADAYNQKTFRPLEEGIVSDAKNFDTEGNRERLAGLAENEVSLAGASARDSGERALTRSGVNPNDGSYGALERGADNQIMLGRAAAGNKARADATTMGHAMKMDAASLGRNLPSQQATAAGLAVNAGSAAAANGQIPLQVQQNGTAQVGQGINTAISANNSAGNLYGTAANINQQASGTDLTGLANLGMAGAKLWSLSDKNTKTRRRPMKGEAALAIARKMPVEKWRYRNDGPGADGGKEHVGPMAQSVQAAAGNEVAPGGKVVDVGSLTGITLAAVQQLDKKVRKLEGRKA